MNTSYKIIILDYFSEIVYIISVSLQLSAALILINSISLKPEDIKKMAIKENGKTVIIDFKGDISKEIVQEVAETSIKNKAAFIMLFIGYLSGIFGKQIEGLKIVDFISVFVISLSMYYIIKYVAKKMSMSEKYSDVSITDGDILKGASFIKMKKEMK